jgi:hypothetical protein
MNNDDPLVGLNINYNIDASFFINKSKKYVYVFFCCISYKIL